MKVDVCGFPIVDAAWSEIWNGGRRDRTMQCVGDVWSLC